MIHLNRNFRLCMWLLWPVAKQRVCVLILMCRAGPPAPVVLNVSILCGATATSPTPSWVENPLSRATWPHSSVWNLLNIGIGENSRAWGRTHCVLFSWLWGFVSAVSSQPSRFPWNLIVSCQIWNASTSCLHWNQSSSGCSLNKLRVHVKYIHIYIYASMCMTVYIFVLLIQCIHLLIFNYIWYKSEVCCKTLYLRTVLKKKKSPNHTTQLGLASKKNYVID